MRREEEKVDIELERSHLLLKLILTPRGEVTISQASFSSGHPRPKCIPTIGSHQGADRPVLSSFLHLQHPVASCPLLSGTLENLSEHPLEF